jgi:predicted PolB exonuclease-like 3'-5' exonuclease
MPRLRRAAGCADDASGRPMTPLLVFDIETVPDVAGIRRIHDIDASIDDAGVLDWFLQRRRASAGSDFAPIYLQQVVAIACALRDAAGIRIWSIGDASDPEPELIRRFFDGIERYTPQLVSWNGGGFDLPVLNHRALIHGVTASRYWDWGDDDREFKFNNYLARFHTRHLDVMDVVAQYQPRASAGLDAIARLCGFPGKLGMEGSEVAAAVAAGRIHDVRCYCECDVLNTYLVYQRFRLMRGEIDAGEYANELSLVRERIGASDAPHWRAFVAKWTGAAPCAPATA